MVASPRRSWGRVRRRTPEFRPGCRESSIGASAAEAHDCHTNRKSFAWGRRRTLGKMIRCLHRVIKRESRCEREAKGARPSTKGEIHRALDKLSREKGPSVKDTTNRKEPAALVAKECGKQLGKSRGMDDADSAGAHPGLARRSIMLKLLYTTAQARVALAEPLHVPHPIRETDDRAAWCNARTRPVIISDLDGTLFFGVDLTQRRVPKSI